jgi:hypothetical protein
MVRLGLPGEGEKESECGEGGDSYGVIVHATTVGEPIVARR